MPTRTLRVLHVFGSAIGILCLFISSLLAGAVIHLDSPRARRLTALQIDRSFDGSFRGRIRVERIGTLGLFGLACTDVTIDDPGGRPVLRVRGLRVRFATIGAARSAFLDRKNLIVLSLPEVSIEDADVRLDTDPEGRPDLFDTFAPRGPTAPTARRARGFELVISRVAARHLRAHGRVAGAPSLDVDIQDLAGTLECLPDVLEGEVFDAKVATHGLLSGADVVGSLSGRVKESLTTPADLDARLTYNGQIGGIAHSIRAAFARNELEAVFDVPRAAPGDIRALWPGLAIGEPSSLHLEAHGILPEIDASLRARVGAATLDASAQFVFGRERRLALSLEANDVDMGQFAASLPRSQLDLRATAHAASRGEGTLDGDLLLSLLKGRVARYTIPRATVTGTLARPDPRHLRARLDVLVDEPSAPTRFTLLLSPGRGRSAFDFDLTSESTDLDRVPQLAHEVRGSARLHATGRLDWSRMTIEATVTADTSDVTLGDVRVHAAHLEARALGGLAAPRIEMEVHSRGAVVDGRHLDTVNVTATGAAPWFHVEASARGPDVPDVDAAFDLGLGATIELRTTRVSVARGRDHAVLTAEQVRVARGNLRLTGLRLEGTGAPAFASLSWSRDEVRFQASANGLDLGRIARLAHAENDVQQGTVSIDADVDVRRNLGTGKCTIALTGASIGRARGVAALAHFDLGGLRLAATLHAEAQGVGVVDVSASKIELPESGSLFDGAWRRASGSVGIDARANLAKIAALLPAERIPLSDARGDLVLHAHVTRETSEAVPDVAVSLTTDHLGLAQRPTRIRDVDGALVPPLPSWRLDGIDFAIDGSVDGRSGAVEVSTRARDVRGDLAWLHLTCVKFPFQDLFGNRRRLEEAARKTSFNLALEVPERDLDRVPDSLKQNYVGGRFRARVAVKGTLLAPDLRLVATLERSRRTSHAGADLPVDLDVAARYDGRRADASIEATSGKAKVLDARADLHAAIDQLLEDRGARRWSASLSAHFDRFPLEAFARVSDKRFSGLLSGDVSVTDLHQDARAKATLSIDTPKIGSFTYRSARIEASVEDREIEGAMRIDQADGSAEAHVNARGGWGAAIVPRLDPVDAPSVSLTTKNFRLAGLLSFFEGTFDELDGRLDSDARLELDPQTRGAKLSGELMLSRGTLKAVAGGGEFHDVSALARLLPDGTIRLEKFTASGLAGRLEATAVGHLDGMHLRAAEGLIVIPSQSAIPLTAGGVQIGNVDGRVELNASAPPGRPPTVTVTVPHLRVVLPDSLSTNVVPLGPMDRVSIGARRGQSAAFVALPLGPPTAKSNEGSARRPSAAMTIATDLADVEIVRGAEIKLDLDGHVNVASDGTTDVTGQIRIKRGGTLSIQGRRFAVEDGTVTFVGPDPSNPQVVVKAGWTAPDGTVVYANFVGPLKTGKVKLQSEPPLAREEIVQLLLYGAAEGQQVGASQASAETGAIGTVGGQAAEPLNRILGQLGLGAVTASIDTTRPANPRPEVEVQIARDISLQIAVVVGNPPPGVNPDHTFLTLSYRFLSRWSLASTVGDAGTTIVDLLWKKRY